MYKYCYAPVDDVPNNLKKKKRRLGSGLFECIVAVDPFKG